MYWCTLICLIYKKFMWYSPFLSPLFEYFVFFSFCEFPLDFLSVFGAIVD